MSPPSTSGPSTNVQQQTVSDEAGPSRQRPRGRRTGGSGKKGKNFLEDKAGLMSLMNNVTDTKDAIRDSRLAKQKATVVPADNDRHSAKKRKSSGGGVGPGAGKSNAEKKRIEKEEALIEAKQAIAAKKREKKLRKKIATNTTGTSKSSVPRKRVGFA